MPYVAGTLFHLSLIKPPPTVRSVLCVVVVVVVVVSFHWQFLSPPSFSYFTNFISRHS